MKCSTASCCSYQLLHFVYIFVKFITSSRLFHFAHIQIIIICCKQVYPTYSFNLNRNGVYSVFTEFVESGLILKGAKFYRGNPDGNFFWRVVQKLSPFEAVRIRTRQGFPVDPMENPIAYLFNGRFSTHHKISWKWSQSKEG